MNLISYITVFYLLIDPEVHANLSAGGNRTHDLRIKSTVTLPTELRGRTEPKGGDDLGGESRRRESMMHLECISVKKCIILISSNTPL